ncbi:hypothetical protein M5K25_015274 [Dendrobium thyrsiflorum]|uniref:Uncharacterized protein n=1 Tax=Dendrobium thyrsiflorum TaxID=117978 RepID=A0ABD0UWZ2_DENTH
MENGINQKKSQSLYVLPHDLQVREPDRHVAFRYRHGVVFDEAQELNPARYPRLGVEVHLTGHGVGDQVLRLAGEAGPINSHGNLNVGRSMRGDAAGEDVGVADVGGAVEKAGGAVVVGEGGAVGVVDEDVEGEGEVDGKGEGGEGEVRGGAGDGGGDELSARVAGAEEGEGEDDDDGGEEEEEEEKQEEKEREAAAVEGFGDDGGGRGGAGEAGFCHWREQQGVRVREGNGGLLD